MACLLNNLAAARAHYQAFLALEGTLNIDYHLRLLLVKALNKGPTKLDAAIALGIPEKTLYNWLDRYDILFDPRTEIYY